VKIKPLKPLPPYDRLEGMSVANRTAAKRARCQKCGAQFQAHQRLGWQGTVIIVGEIETSNMRGDDVVHFFHPECAPSR